MAKETIFEMKSSAMDSAIAQKAGKLEVMTPPKGMSFKVEVEFDKNVAKEAGKDPLLKNQMVDACKEVYDDLVNRIADNLQKTDKGAIQLRDTNQLDKLQKLVSVVNKGIEGARDVALEAAEKAVQKVYDELSKTRKEYAKYKIKIGAKITLAAAGIIASITLFATGVVSFGATSIPAVVGMAKSLVVIGSEIVSAAQEIETAQNRLEKKLKEIEQKFVNAKGEFTARGMTQEAGTALLAQFFGTGGPFAVLPSIKDCVNDLGVVKSKFKGITLKTHDAAKQLNKILETIDEARAKFLEKVAKELNKHPSELAKSQPAKVAEQLDDELAPFTAKVINGIDKVEACAKRVKEAEPKVKDVQTRLDELVKLKGKGWKIFENVLVLSDLGLSFADPGQYSKLATEFAASIGQAGGSLVADKITKKVLEGTFLE